ncbi:MAG: restriction endonuclease subunit S [Pseudomonadota bacterium]
MNFEKICLGDVCTFQEGYVNPSQKISEYFDGPIKWLRANDLNNAFVYETSRTLSKRGFESAGKSAVLFEPETLAISKSGTIGRLGILKDHMCGNRAVINIKPDPNLADPLFVFYALLHDQHQISTLADGSVQKNLYVSALSGFEYFTPSLSDQVRVSRTLASLDDKIELNRRMNETLEEISRALFRDWFVDFGPTRRQMEGATDPTAIMGQAFPPQKAATLAPLFPAKLGEDGLPEGWYKQPVGELAEIVGGGTPNTKTDEFWEGGTHLWATPRDLSKLSGVFIGDTERKLTDAGLAKVSSGLSPKGSVLMSSRAPIGYLAIASQPVAVNQGFIVIRPTDQLPTQFAKLWCEANMETIEANANGSTFQEISKKNFKPILATVPSADVMTAFSNFAGLLFEKVQANEQENQTLAALRDLLLPKLMSGEIRLKDAENAS